jgi:intracellular septation protein A
MNPVHLQIPDLRTVVRHAAPRFIEGTVVPLVLFVVLLRVVGVWGAMVAGLAWVYTAIAVRLVMRKRVPGILMLGAVTLTARTIITAVSGSIVVYFLQPSLGTMLVAGAFLLSVPLDRPLAGRLANDFCPLPDDMHANLHVRRFFRQISLLWAFAQAANAAITVYLLFSQSLGTFVVLRSVVSSSVTITAIVASALWFKRSMKRNGIHVQLPGWRRAPA